MSVRRLSLALLVVLALVAAGCGVPRDESAQRLSGNDVPVDFRPGASLATPSTVATAGATDDATIYLVRDGRLAPVIRKVAADTGRPQAEVVIDALFAGPTPEETAQGYTSALDRARSATACDGKPAAGSKPVVIVRGGTASLQLPVGFQGTAETQIAALAQLVYSVTGLAGIGRVVFLCNASPIEVFRADSSIVTTVAREDYCDPGSADVRFRTLCPLPGADITIFLLKDGRLAPVIRSIAVYQDRPQSELVIDELLKGPTSDEATAGYRSALEGVMGDASCDTTGSSSTVASVGSAASTGLDSVVTVRGGTASVDLGHTLSGSNTELVAGVAQLVYTATTQAGVGRVRIVCGGKPIDVLRADGAIVQGFDSVTREDYCDPASSDAKLRTLCPLG